MNKRFIFASMVSMFALVACPLKADTLSLDSASGVWQNAQKAGGGLPTSFSGGGTDTIHWGTPAGGSGQSGYNFTPTAPPPVSVLLDTPFILGTFTHYNFPITGNALASVDLSVSANVMVNGTPEAFSGVFNFLHDETPNTSPGCCNDIVSFINNIAQLGTFDIGGVPYTIGLLGFKTSLAGPLLSQFSTVEGQTNTAYLYAKISRPEVFAPEPATYLMMGGFLLVGAFARRKKQAQVGA